MRKILVFLGLLLALVTTARADPWDVGTGPQPIAYSSSHTLGDGSDAKGGQAPYYSTFEVNDIATNSTIVTQWTLSCPAGDYGQLSCGEYQPPQATFVGHISGTNLTVDSGPSAGTITVGQNLIGTGISAWTVITSGSGSSWVVNNSQTIASETMQGRGGEAKARFDCNIAFHEKNDPILDPGVSGGSTHDHSFFGALGFQGQAQNITYYGLRNATGGGTYNGYSTCYAGPLNRTLYWEPSMEIPVNGVVAVLQPFTIPTYYICGDYITGTSMQTQAGPVNCSRWPRGFNMIFGFNMSDPTDTWGHNAVTAGGGGYSYNAQTGDWYCAAPNTPSYTSYAPNQAQNAHEPWFNDSNGHVTLNCLATQSTGFTASFNGYISGTTLNVTSGSGEFAGENITATGITTGTQIVSGSGSTWTVNNAQTLGSSGSPVNFTGDFCAIGSTGCGYAVVGQIVSPECWDGHNHSSPNGRQHLIQRIRDNNYPGNICPDHWYLIPHFEAKPEFLFLTTTEMGKAYLSSDRMAGMPEAMFSGHISGTTLTLDGNVTAPGAIIANHVITGTGVTVGTKIISGSGQTTGSTWTVDTAQTVSSTTISVQYNGGETFHADLFPAWDYGTGDNPGFMLGFFQHCDGLTMHVKNSDGVTYTDLIGDPHECDYGRIDATRQGVVNSPPPDGNGPNPVVSLTPDQSGAKRYFALPAGTPLPGSQINQHH